MCETPGKITFQNSLTSLIGQNVQNYDGEIFSLCAERRYQLIKMVYLLALSSLVHLVKSQAQKEYFHLFFPIFSWFLIASFLKL